MAYTEDEVFVSCVSRQIVVSAHISVYSSVVAFGFCVPRGMGARRCSTKKSNAWVYTSCPVFVASICGRGGENHALVVRGIVRHGDDREGCGSRRETASVLFCDVVPTWFS